MEASSCRAAQPCLDAHGPSQLSSSPTRIGYIICEALENEDVGPFF